MSDLYKTDLLNEISNYYSEKLAEHGESPQGVDWNGQESQTLRFEQLYKVIDTSTHFSVNDLGCGYGAFYDFLKQQSQLFSYTGVDVSEDMVRAAKQRYSDKDSAHFIFAREPDKIADYGIASGIFNVRLNRTDKEWLSYLETTLDTLDRTSRSGFSFNCLTSYSDAEKMKDYLYYANPSELFDFCKCHYSRNVALLHDYDLYEFTILVKK